MSDKRSSVLLGYEVGSGDPVRIPMLNLAVTGQTQQSGKTTTLEALVHRAGGTSIAFVTKRGERAFADAHRVQPYFRDRADWVFVDQLLSAVMQEKNKFLRQFLIPVCRTTKTLGDVQTAVKRKLLTTKRSYDLGGLTQLDAYLELIVPQIKRAKLANTLALKPGLNVMDVSTFSLPMQMLFVQSALDWVNEFEQQTIVVIPEAWEFIPEGKGSPAKSSAIALVRKGSGIGNHIWVDSQDMAGVDKEILRGCPVWLIGVQREANELKRALSNIPKSVKRPTVDAIATLERGQFYACWETHAIKTYVQPAWMTDAQAQQVATGHLTRDVATRLSPGRRAPHHHEEEDDVKPEEARRIQRENERLSKDLEAVQRENDALARRIAELEGRADRRDGSDDDDDIPVATSRGAGRGASAPSDNGQVSDELYQALRARLTKDPVVLRVLQTKPVLEIEVKREVIKADGDSLRGRIGRLIKKGFFADGVSGVAVQKELARQGKDFGPGNTYSELDRLALMGFLTIEEGKDDRGRKRKEYHEVEDMTVNVLGQ